MSKVKLLNYTVILSLLFTIVVPATVMAQEELHVGVGYPYATINAAITAADDGDTIVVHEGTYSELVHITQSNITLMGDGAILDGVAFPDEEDGLITIESAFHGVTIEGFEICNFEYGDHGGNGIFVQNYSYANTLTNNYIRDVNGAGIFLAESSSGNLITENSISLCENGVGASYSHGNQIIGNHLEQNNHGIFMCNGCSNNTISENTITSSWTNGITLGGNYNQILNNDIEETGEAGISLDQWGEAFGSTGNLINGNQISDSYRFGITITSSDDNQIVNNEVFSCRYHGIQVQNGSDGNLIEENTVYECGLGDDEETIHPGIAIERSSSNNVVQNNEVYNSGAGINCFIEANDNQILENTVYNCGHIRDGDPATIRFGIGVNQSSGNVVENNEVYDCARGIDLAMANANQVLNNTIYDCGLLEFETGSGIGIYESNNNLVENNGITNCGGFGVELNNSSNDNQVLKNIISYCGLGDDPRPSILISTSNNNLVQKNEIYNGIAGIVVETSNDNKVMKNVIIDMARDGIVIVRDSTNNLVKKNNVSNCRNGIGLKEAYDNRISKNEVTASTEVGIVAGRSMNNLIDRNYVSGSGWYDLSDFPKPPQNIWKDNYYTTSDL